MEYIDQGPGVPEDLLRYVQPVLDEGFGNPKHSFAIVGRSGCVYYFGGDELRQQAEEQRALVQGTLDEELFIIDRPVEPEI